MAKLLNITDRRLQQLVEDEHMPRIGRGIYEIVPCVHWYIAYVEARTQGRLGDEGKREGQHIKNKLMLTKLQEASGDLIPRKVVMDVWTSAFLRLGKWFDGLAASLGREFGWSAETIKAVRLRLDEAREDYAKDSAEYIRKDGADEPARKRS